MSFTICYDRSADYNIPVYHLRKCATWDQQLGKKDDDTLF